MLKNPEITKVLNTAVDAWAKTHPDQVKLKFRALHLAYAFAVVVFGGICLLAWQEVLGKEGSIGLLGALIGYWFGNRDTP